MDVMCMTLDEINSLKGKEVYAVRDFYVRKCTVHWVLWHEDIITLGFVKNDPYHSDNARIEHTCLTKDGLLKELPNYVFAMKKIYKDQYDEELERAKYFFDESMKELEKDEQRFLKQLESM